MHRAAQPGQIEDNLVVVCRDVPFRQASKPSSHDRDAGDDLLIAQTKHEFPQSSLYARMMLDAGPDVEQPPVDYAQKLILDHAGDVSQEYGRECHVGADKECQNDSYTSYIGVCCCNGAIVDQSSAFLC